jgi:hypothetical protein
MSIPHEQATDLFPTRSLCARVPGRLEAERQLRRCDAQCRFGQRQGEASGARARWHRRSGLRAGGLDEGNGWHQRPSFDVELAKYGPHNPSINDDQAHCSK